MIDSSAPVILGHFYENAGGFSWAAIMQSERWPVDTTGTRKPPATHLKISSARLLRLSNIHFFLSDIFLYRTRMSGGIIDDP